MNEFVNGRCQNVRNTISVAHQPISIEQQISRHLSGFVESTSRSQVGVEVMPLRQRVHTGAYLMGRQGQQLLPFLLGHKPH